MAVIQPGGVGVTITADDKTHKGIKSAESNLGKLQEAANRTADRMTPLQQILNGGMLTGAGAGGMAAISGGMRGLFDSSQKAGQALNKATQSIEGAGKAGSSAATGIFKIGAGIAAASAVLKGSIESFNGFRNLTGGINGFFESVKSGYAQAMTAAQNAATTAKAESAQTYLQKDRLVELVKTRTKNAEQIQEATALVERMNAQYKGLNLTIDQTGKIGNTFNLKKRIDQAERLNQTTADSAVRRARLNQLDQIAARLGVQNATAADRKRAATLLLSNAEAGAALKKKILNLETYKEIANNIKAVFWKNSSAVATHRQSLANTICAATNTVLGVTAKGAAAAMLALKASMATNPIGWIMLAVEGIAMLTMGIVSLVKSWYNAASAAEKAAEATEKWQQSAGKNRDQHLILIDRLEELNRKKDLNRDEKAEAKKIADELNAYYQLGLTIDENTGKITGNNKALKDARKQANITRKINLETTIEAQEKALDEQYRKVAKERKKNTEWDNATEAQKARLRVEFEDDPKNGETIRKFKDKIKDLQAQRKEVIDAINAEEKAAREREAQRRKENEKRVQSHADFAKSEENKMKLEGMDETARQIEEVNQEYNKRKRELVEIWKVKEKNGESIEREWETYKKLDKLQTARIEKIKQEAAEKEKKRLQEEREKETEKDRQKIQSLQESIRRNNRTSMQNELADLRASVDERRKALELAKEQGKATEEQLKDLETLNNLEKERAAQIRKRNLEEIAASNRAFAESQKEREDRKKQNREDKKFREQLEINPFKVATELRERRNAAAKTVEIALAKVNKAREAAEKKGDQTPEEKERLQQIEKELQKAQEEQDRIEGMTEEAETAARSKVAELIQMAAIEKTPSVLDSKMYGTVEAYKAEIENQQRGNQDPKLVKIDQIAKILEKQEQAEAERTRQVIEIGRQLVQNINGV